MTDYEPYVTDPAEPPPTVVLERLRSPLAVTAALVLAAAVAVVVISVRGAEDPSLDIPLDQFAPPGTTTPATAPPTPAQPTPAPAPAP